MVIMGRSTCYRSREANTPGSPVHRDGMSAKPSPDFLVKEEQVELRPHIEMPMNRRERRAAAKGSVRATPAKTTPAALYEAGLQHFYARRQLDAQICCQQALALDPGQADTIHLIGLLVLRARDHDHAVEWISRAIRQQPKTEYLTNLGTALLNQGRREEALAANCATETRDRGAGCQNQGKVDRRAEASDGRAGVRLPELRSS
jgi:tetratricopeptide (TPR) repeat protein